MVNHIISSESEHDPNLLSKYNALHGGGEVVAPPFLPTNQIKAPKKGGPHVKYSCTRLTCDKLKEEINVKKVVGLHMQMMGVVGEPWGGGRHEGK